MTACAVHAASAFDRRAGDVGVRSVYRLCWSSNWLWLACTKRDDAPDRIVRRNADGHAIARNYFDTEAAHAAAQLGQHFVTCVTLHAIKPPAMHGHDCALHVDQIVLAQLVANPFL